MGMERFDLPIGWVWRELKHELRKILRCPVGESNNARRVVPKLRDNRTPFRNAVGNGLSQTNGPAVLRRFARNT